MTTNQNTNKPELLAPCGSLEAFFAAMESGADAVYIGLREFSARARAKNFTLGQLGRMLTIARQKGRRIYITLNTLIKEQELPQLIETLAELSQLRVDGVIVQDMAVARIARKYFPALPLHASTQMTIHNLPGVKLLEELGFERVVLARELQLADIASIASQCSAELEVFVHGALCFCVSGQCHFSSFMGGHSGNRGRCAQPCRRLYSQRGKEGYYFSPNDLSAIELVPELAAAGVKSLKIEGRMKSADYVAKVVKAYRLMLDSSNSDQKQALATAKELLKDSFGRTPTKGFLASANPADIANPWLRGGTGRYIGEVRQFRQGRILFECRDTLQVGDRLRLQPKSDKAGQSWTLREIYQHRKSVHTARAGTLLEVACPFSPQTGDALFKVGAADAFGISDEAANRRLLAAGPDKQLVLLRFACVQDKGNGHWALQISAKVNSNSFDYQFPLGLLEASRSSDMVAVLSARFSETGETPFSLRQLEAVDFPAIFIPPAMLKQIRRELYSKLEQDLTSVAKQQTGAARQLALAELKQTGNARKEKTRQEELLLQVATPGDIRWAFSQGADQAIVQLTRANIHSLNRYITRLRPDSGKIIWQLPFMLFDHELDLMQQTLQMLHQAGFRNFELTNPGQFKLMEQFDDLRLSGGYRLFSLNSQALAQWFELGLTRATHYIEDGRDNLVELLTLPYPLSVLVYSPVEMMVTRIRIKDVKGGAELVSDRDDRYTVKSRDGLDQISSNTPFSLTGRINELRQLGCSSFRLDLSETPVKECENVLQAFRADRPLQGTTEFNYERGLV